MLKSAKKVSVALLFFFAALPVCAETLPSGTDITIRLDRDVKPSGKNSKDSKNTEKFSGTLAFPVFSNGREVVPAGSRVEGEVRGDKKSIFLSPRHLILPDGRKLDFTATVSAVDATRLKAEKNEGVIEGSANTGEAVQQAGQIGTEGAIIGALSTGTWTGMAVGAAVGVGAVVVGRKVAGMGKGTVIPAGTQLDLNLNQPLEIPESAIGAQAAQETFSNREDRRPILRRENPSPDTNNDAPTQ